MIPCSLRSAALPGSINGAFGESHIYVAFGEHPPVGVCVRVRSSKLVVSLLGCFRVYVCWFFRLILCSFGFLLLHTSFRFLGCFVGWLAACVYVCFHVFRHVASHARVLIILSCPLADPATPLEKLGLHFSALAGKMNVLLVFARTLGLNCFILGLILGTLGIHFGVFLEFWGWTVDPYCHLSGKGTKQIQSKDRKCHLAWMYFLRNCQVLLRNCKVRFDCACASGLGFRPLRTLIAVCLRA